MKEQTSELETPVLDLMALMTAAAETSSLDAETFTLARPSRQWTRPPWPTC